jgi:hypothetical protein
MGLRCELLNPHCPLFSERHLAFLFIIILDRKYNYVNGTKVLLLARGRRGARQLLAREARGGRRGLSDGRRRPPRLG